MRFECPLCKKLISVKENELGAEVECAHCDKLVKVPETRYSTGAVIADFILRKELGRGGMGIVYEAHQISLDRPAALKILAESFAKDSEFVADFIREARSAAKLNHPHIVQAYAVGEDEHIFYFAMEYIDGETMKQVLKNEKIIPVERAVAVIQEIAEALDYAWKEQQLIHCDIKPDNIMITAKGVAKLADLGLARKAEDSQNDDEDEIMGTPQYISPEHLTGSPMDVRSDLYSLGATFYQFVTGRLPFEGNNINEVAKKRLEEDPVPPHELNQEIPEVLSGIIMKMMKRDPNERYQDAKHLIDDLKKFRRGKLTTVTSGIKKFSIRKHETGEGEASDKAEPANVGDKLPTEGDAISMDGETAKKSKAKLFALLGSAIGLLLIGGAIYLWLSVAPQTIPTPGGGPATSNGSQSSAQSKVSKYRQQLEIILSVYQKKPQDTANLLKRVDQFIERYPVPLDSNAFDKLMAIYIPLDEKLRVAPARAELQKKHASELAKNEIEEKQRLAEEKRQAEEAKKQRELAEKERKMAEELAAQERAAKAKEQRRIAEYKSFIANKKDEFRFKFIDYCVKRDFAAVEKMLKSADQELEKVRYNTPEEIDIAKQFVQWVNSLKDGLKTGEKVYNLFNNSGKTLADKQFEIQNYQLVTIQSIKDGKAQVKLLTSDGPKIINAPLDNFGVYFMKFFSKTVKKHNIPNAYFFYYLVQGRFGKNLENAAPDSFWKNELPQMEYQYFKHKLKTATPSEKAQLAKAFGTLDSFKKALNQ